MASRRPGHPSVPPVPHHERQATAADVLTRRALDSVAGMTGRADLRLGITDVAPVVSCGAFSARAVVGEHLPITATVFREGHDAVAADVVVTGPDGSRQPFDRVAAEADDDWRDRVAEAAAALRDTSRELPARVAPALAEALQRYLHDHPVRELVTPGPENEVWVDRPRALFGSWYEFFPRSTGPVVDGRATHGTFATSAERLPAIADMGFDVVYLPPIHPIGTVNRKGPNSAQYPGGNPHEVGPDDPGSPWAIGSAEGGHDAVHPQLGTMEDFRAFVERTRELGMEVALDFALQAAPDHPWVKEHPEWFTTKPDGTIAYAENPPKKYQDIYPINFDNDPEGIYAECLRVIRVWIEAGVKIFRVDNPHTKPLNFLHWLIWEAKKTDPGPAGLAARRGVGAGPAPLLAPDQRDPPRPPGAAAAAHPVLPPGRQPEPALL